MTRCPCACTSSVQVFQCFNAVPRRASSLRTALWLGTAAAAAASSGSSSGSGAPDENCPLGPPERRIGAEQVLRGTEAGNRERWPENGTDTTVLQCCDAICPNPSAADFHQKCADHVPPEYTEWQDAAYQQSTLQWNVFFVAFSLLLGALFKQFLPSQVPYTVGLLLVFILFGLLAQKLSDGVACPSHAWWPLGRHEPLPAPPPEVERRQPCPYIPLPMSQPRRHPNPAAPNRSRPMSRPPPRGAAAAAAGPTTTPAPCRRRRLRPPRP